MDELEVGHALDQAGADGGYGVGHDEVGVGGGVQDLVVGGATLDDDRLHLAGDGEVWQVLLDAGLASDDKQLHGGSFRAARTGWRRNPPQNSIGRLTGSGRGSDGA